ncbi:hypothetical protein CLIB1423_04S07360 [[Candida] railenensis]|uniref:Uncharacterized protein n=1 Tax=[Candida] railenensis TaxID=45579 RepID=A0A9P0QM93_9ASCO|nr:hypothetical protein CLIB1423_04S07360 [[Candida] railenensis]
MAIHSDYLKSTIHEAIGQYNRVSKSKTLKHLVPSNESRLFELINGDKKIQAELQDILSKKDHYVNKLNKLLDSLIQKHGVRVIESKDVSLVKDNVPLPNNDATSLDSKFICTRYHARQYITNVLPQSSKQEIKKTIERHFEFQKYYEDKRKELIGNPSYNDEQLQTRLDEMDYEVFKQQETYEQESLSILKSFNIPFFSIAKGWDYPELDEDKKFILEVIAEHFGK